MIEIRGGVLGTIGDLASVPIEGPGFTDEERGASGDFILLSRLVCLNQRPARRFTQTFSAAICPSVVAPAGVSIESVWS